MRIILDAGHGGSDSGACAFGLKEKDLNLEYTRALRDILNTYEGVEVIMTRDSDDEPSLQDRTDYANSFNGIDLFLSLHLNSFNEDANGTEVIHSILADRNFIGFCESICRSICSAIGTNYRRVFSMENDYGQDYYHVIRETVMPAMIIEALFISNQSDLTKYNPQKIAAAIADNIAAFYGLKKKYVAPPPPPPPITQSKTLYQVVAGTYGNKQNAIEQLEKLKMLGIDCFITVKNK